MEQKLLRKLPKVDEILKEKRIRELCGKIPRSVVVGSIREYLGELRDMILAGNDNLPAELMDLPLIAEKIAEKAERKGRSNLKRVINGTGIPLHTNLGRACLSERACRQAAEAGAHYSNLEYDLDRGKRGSRNDHVEGLIAGLTGAESAMAVNNNAAAVMLCLNVLGRGREVIVSRGELVEIGGSFRIPEIMEQSGCRLIETGTTNRTRIEDYERAITENTAVLMKVHTSNYRITGFAEEASLKELRELGEKYSVPVVYDLGSGLMVDLREYGIDEPTVAGSLKDGAEIVLFSGDKLLGGPQSGIIAGKKRYVDKMKKHPLARVMRVGKMTLAALEATLREYLDTEKAMENVPALRSLTASKSDLLQRARKLAVRIKERSPELDVGAGETENSAGGGSAPGDVLEGAAVALSFPGLSAQELAGRLRRGAVPVIGRISHDKVMIDLRTVSPDEEDILTEQIGNIIREQEKL